MGLIRTLNYLDVTRISHFKFFRKQCWHLVSEWTLSLMNALKYHWFETCLLSQAVWRMYMWCPKILSSRSLCKALVLYPAENAWHCSISKIFHVMLCTLLLKRKLQHVGHKWVTSELFCGSVGQMGQQVWPTFNPVAYLQVCILLPVTKPP